MRFPLARQFRDFISTASMRADAGLGVVGSPGAADDYWYQGTGQRSGAGPEVSAGSATRLAPVFSCVRVVTETFGSLPIGIFRERKGGGRDLATDHPAQELFLQPNKWQTGMEFFEMMQGHLELRGNSYALKVSGNGNAIDELIPLHPDRVRVYLLPDGRLRYEVTSYSSGHIDRYAQEQILHFRARSNDGIMGISTISANTESIGVGLAQQEHRAASFRHRAIPGLSIETQVLKEQNRQELADSIEERFSGNHAFGVMVLPPGMKATELGVSNRDAQLIEASAASAIEVCGFFRTPPHKIGIMARGTFSNIEQQNIEFATDCMWPRIVRVERRLDRDIVGSLRYKESAAGDYFAVFNMDALYRGDMKTRFDAYQSGVQTWLTRNEIRAAEGKNPIAGLDEPLIPVNMETISQAQARQDANIAAANASAEDAAATRTTTDQAGGGAEPLDDDPEDENGRSAKAALGAQQKRAGAIAIAAAGRIVRREVKTLRKLAAKSAADGPPIEGEVWDFYRDLAPVVAEALAIPAGVATVYCTGHAAAVTTAKASLLDMAIDRIEEDGAKHLADLALTA
jgi:HK97 family phage portal protein